MTKGGGLLLFLSIFFFLIFLFKAPSFWSVCLESWVWIWISKVGLLLGMAKRCLCFDLGFVLSGYFQGLGFEDISKWVYWAVWPCVYVLCSWINVNLSMCKQNVFKHRHVWAKLTERHELLCSKMHACMNKNDVYMFCVSVCTNLDIGTIAC